MNVLPAHVEATVSSIVNVDGSVNISLTTDNVAGMVVVSAFYLLCTFFWQ